MTVMLLTEHHLEFLSLKGGCTGSSESIHVKMPHFWKSHVTANKCFILTLIIKVLLIISSVMLFGLSEFLTVLDVLKTLLLSLSLELSLDLLTKAFVNMLGSVIPAKVYV